MGVIRRFLWTIASPRLRAAAAAFAAPVWAAGLKWAHFRVRWRALRAAYGCMRADCVSVPRRVLHVATAGGELCAASALRVRAWVGARTVDCGL